MRSAELNEERTQCRFQEARCLLLNMEKLAFDWEDSGFPQKYSSSISCGGSWTAVRPKSFDQALSSVLERQ